MVSCVEAIIETCKTCGAKDLVELCALMGVREAAPAIKTGIKTPETEKSSAARYKGFLYFLYDCEGAKCPPQKCTTLTHCAQLIWKTPKPTQGHDTNIRAIEDSKDKGVERPYLYRIFGPDRTAGIKGWRGYGGTVNQDEVLAGKACPGEVPKEFRWTQKDIDEWLKDNPGITPKPMTVIMIGHNPAYGGEVTPRAGPTEEARVQKEKPKKHEPEETGTTTIGDKKLRWVKKGEKITYFDTKGVEVPTAIVQAARQAQEEIIKLQQEREREGK